MKKKKLSLIQLSVLIHLNTGWELGHNRGYGSRAWIQKGGVGKGGKSKTISQATFTVLLQMKAIEMWDGGYPTDKYCISESGKELLTQIKSNEQTREIKGIH
jgi:hypothetical protein